MDTKISPDYAGCWIDGHWGRFGSSRLLSIAESLGWPLASDSDLIIAINCHDDSTQDCGNPDCCCAEIVFDATDEAENWLNENIAPEGFSFGWYDGEFFLWSLESWEEESY